MAETDLAEIENEKAFEKVKKILNLFGFSLEVCFP